MTATEYHTGHKRAESLQETLESITSAGALVSTPTRVTETHRSNTRLKTLRPRGRILNIVPRKGRTRSSTPTAVATGIAVASPGPIASPVAPGADACRDESGHAPFVKHRPGSGKSESGGLLGDMSHVDPDADSGMTMSQTQELTQEPIASPLIAGLVDGHTHDLLHNHNHSHSHGESEKGPVLDSMSLVSPPFSPSQSTIDLVQAASRASPPASSQWRETSVQPSTNPTSSGAVRRELEELPEVFCESRARIPTTTGGEFFLHVYRNNVDNKEHLAIVFGDDIHSKTLFAPRDGETEHDRMVRGAYTGKLHPGRAASLEDAEPAAGHGSILEKDTLVRIHSECYTGETAWSARCDCGEQLDEAARLMKHEGKGVIVYLRQEGRGIGLGEKLKAYNLQDLGADTVQANLMLRHPADARSFGMATAILMDLGLDHIRLLTNNPDKITAVEGKHHEVTVTRRVPMVPLSWQNKGGFQSKEVDKYLETKVKHMGHMLDFVGRSN